LEVAHEPTRAEQQRHARHRRWPWAVALVGGLVVAGVVGGLVATAFDSDSSSSSSSKSAPEKPSVCPATTVANKGLPSVVMISVQAGANSGTGSGEVIRSDGEILTNNHVISAAANAGGTISVLFNDGTTTDAQLVGRDPQTDLAVIKVAPHDHLSVMPFGSSANLEVGQPVVALGAPLGFPNTVTAGIVSALDRSVQVPADGGATALLVAAIQTDTAINPGNSGGALVDCNARLVGVPTAGAVVPSPSGAANGGNIGIGFAIPGDFAKAVATEIIDTGKVTHSTFGIQVAPVVRSGAVGGVPSGLFVVGVATPGPSSAAGIQAGDVITEIEGKPATSAEQLLALTLTKKAGEQVKLTYDRNGTSQTAAVTLAAAPTS
jgi:putative serine protease PepD